MADLLTVPPAERDIFRIVSMLRQVRDFLVAIFDRANTWTATQIFSGAATFSGVATFSGLVSVTNGQIKFPATVNASSDANTLDDYEEGTWTPALTFATPGDLSIAYSRQVGQYTKIGRVVHVWFDVRTSTFTHTTASGNFTLTGLPFTVKTVTDMNYRGGGVVWSGITKAGYTDPNVTAVGGGTTATLSTSGSGVAAANVVAADMPTGGSVILASSISYEAA